MQPAPPKMRPKDTMYAPIVRNQYYHKLTFPPGSRCIQNKEGHLCTIHWAEGYNPSIHRKYPKKPPQPHRSTPSSDTSSTLNESSPTNQDPASTDPIVGPVFAIGQSKFLDITINSLLHEKDASTAREATFFDQSLQFVRSAGKQIEEPNRVQSFCSDAAKELEMQHVQSLLPDRETVFKIVDYYHECMLYWFGGGLALSEF
jgi:hypothetical protein